MTVYVYAAYKGLAEQWARAQGLQPRQFAAYGNNSSWRQHPGQYQLGDRVVVLGNLNHQAQTMVEFVHRKSPAGLADIERHPLPIASVS